MLQSLRTKLAAAIAPELKTNAANISPAGMPFPYDSTAYEFRLDATNLLKVLEAGHVDRILMQVFMLCLNGRDIKIITPEDQESDKLSDKSNEVRKRLWQLDKAYNTETLMAQTGLDCMGFGSGLVEMGVQDKPDGTYTFPKTEMGWNAPQWLQYIDAYSLAEQASSTNNTQSYVPGRVLKGIAHDIQNKQMQYWQTQKDGEQPVQLPTARILHIRDKSSRYPDGKSYLAGIAPTVLQLEFVRKAFMQNVNYKGVGRCVVKVNEVRDAQGKLLETPTGTGKRWEKAYVAAVDFVKNYGNNNVGVLWGQDHEVIFPNLGNVGDVVPVDEYLKAEILQHLIPRDFIEQNGQAISTTGTPLLELVMMVVRGWRRIISDPFEALYTEILEANGFTDWACEFTYQDPAMENKLEKQKVIVQAFSLGMLPLNRAIQEMGWQPLAEEEQAEMKEKAANNPMGL
ncbi:hypothetical protein M0R72_16990 [Candidatus Pacearchaeota archaeon]|jgi:hypothetical protein|nr:hypothetical protein [Candidatus Pacearchaeota archaeon]